eukprot:GILJ01003957.1.p1 GENE.GILJ01003957.1~~GILJ01003957.1.p1  ORF type:complete len:336 (-),score=34.50 GILJ01003957.1:113-1120(-)
MDEYNNMADGGSPHQLSDQARTQKDLAAFLKSRSMYELMPESGKVVVVEVELSVKTAMWALAHHELQSAPLWSSAERRFVGMLTMTDVLDVLRHFHAHKLNSKAASTEKISQILEDTSVKEWRAFSADKTPDRPHSFVSVSPISTLYEACSLLKDHRIHRLAVIDGEHHVVLCTVTHDLILQYIVSQFRSNATLFHHQLRDLEIGTFRHVITVQPETPLIDILQMLVEHRISAIPIVDASGVLLDVYCRSDILYLVHDQRYDDLEIPVSEALAARGVPKKGYRVLTCKQTDTLKTVIERLSVAYENRLICVDDDLYVQGIVSLTDLFDYFLREFS